MRCHYDVLEVPRDASLDEIKKSYKKLAIKWHPDKNLENTEAATEQFQILQQAFEVLSDTHERAWYDDHRDAILKGKVGGDYEDDSLDVYQYFTASCYKGFGDDEKGFYSVYSEVFNKIAAEDSEYYTDSESEIEIPSFGKSDSSVEEVKTFYAHWQSYCTKKSFSWLDPYNARQAENRRVSRLIDKENKKVRDKARKARNEEVRELVNFVRKRDKRVLAHAQQQKNLNAEKAKKAEKKRVEKIKERKKELTKHQESEWSKFSNLENELKNIEADLATKFGESISDVNSEDEIIDDQLYCVACNKLFKTPKAFENHESSKKHREKVEILKINMLEGPISEGDVSEESEGDNGEDCFEEETVNKDDYDIDDDDDNEELKEFLNDPLFCSPCAKKFKSSKGIAEHKKSKEHGIMERAYKEIMRDSLGVDEDIDPSRNVFADVKRDTTAPCVGQGDGDATEKKYGGAAALERICNAVDNFTKGNDIIKEEVDRLCKELDDLSYNEDSSLDEFLDMHMRMEANEKLLKSEVKNLHRISPVCNSDDDDDDDFLSDTKKKRRKSQKNKFQYNKCKYKTDGVKAKSDVNSTDVDVVEVDVESWLNNCNSSCSEKSEMKQASNKKKQSKKKNDATDTNTTCVACNTTFPSKNKLFLHLSATGHSVYIGDKDKPSSKVELRDSDTSSSKKGKNRKK